MAQDKLPVKTEFITAKTPARLGSISSSTLSDPVQTLPIPALLAEMDAKDEGRTAGAVLDREERKVEELVKGLDGLAIPSTPTPVVEAVA